MTQVSHYRRRKTASKARLLAYLIKERESQTALQSEQISPIALLVRKLKLLRISALSLKKRTLVKIKELMAKE